MGTIGFWPEVEYDFPAWLRGLLPLKHGEPSALILGCDLFIAGSVIMFLLCSCTFRKLWRSRKAKKVDGNLETGQLVRVKRKYAKRKVADQVRAYYGDDTEENRTTTKSVIDLISTFRGKRVIVSSPGGGEGRCLVTMPGKEPLRDAPERETPSRGETDVYIPYDALERTSDASKFMLEEQALYWVGSLLFMLGTLIWDPSVEHWWGGKHFDHLWWLMFADGLFMLGSFVFSLAAYCNAIILAKQHSSTHRIVRRIAFAVVTCSMLGGFFFIGGTLCFLPARYVVVPADATCSLEHVSEGWKIMKQGSAGASPECTFSLSMARMEKIGCGFYMVGCVLYFFGSLLSIGKTRAMHKIERMSANASLMSADMEGELRSRLEHLMRALEGRTADDAISGERGFSKYNEALDAEVSREIPTFQEVMDGVFEDFSVGYWRLLRERGQLAEPLIPSGA